ncbi:MAG: GrpB family protein [Granulosicoccus sp.]
MTESLHSGIKKLIDACGSYILAIEHVGSTSIPNLVAKPIVDILIGVKALSDAELMIPGMKSVGYDYPDDIGIPDDRIFGRDLAWIIHEDA